MTSLATMRVPEPLRALPGWLIWRYEQFAGEAKPRKIPYWADGTRRHGTLPFTPSGWQIDEWSLKVLEAQAAYIKKAMQLGGLRVVGDA